MWKWFRVNHVDLVVENEMNMSECAYAYEWRWWRGDKRLTCAIKKQVIPVEPTASFRDLSLLIGVRRARDDSSDQFNSAVTTVDSENTMRMTSPSSSTIRFELVFKIANLSQKTGGDGNKHQSLTPSERRYCGTLTHSLHFSSSLCLACNMDIGG